MSHRIRNVIPIGKKKIQAVFQNGEEKQYDISQLYDDFPQFKKLETEKDLYKQVQVDVGGLGISWNDDLDLDAEEIWECGVLTGKQYSLTTMQSLAVSLTEARESKSLTQKQLSEMTGIAQGDISKIENEKANPSVQTLQRLAEGLGTTLQITFVET